MRRKINRSIVSFQDSIISLNPLKQIVSPERLGAKRRKVRGDLDKLAKSEKRMKPFYWYVHGIWQNIVIVECFLCVQRFNYSASTSRCYIKYSPEVSNSGGLWDGWLNDERRTRVKMRVIKSRRESFSYYWFISDRAKLIQRTVQQKLYGKTSPRGFASVKTRKVYRDVREEKGIFLVQEFTYIVGTIY